MTVLTQQQTDLLHAAIELALESWDKDPANDALNAVADTVMSAAFGENELVIMAWSPKYGHCSDCGAPAAYRLTNYSADAEAWLRCSTCAALAASEGEHLIYLFEEDFDTAETANGDSDMTNERHSTVVHVATAGGTFHIDVEATDANGTFSNPVEAASDTLAEVRRAIRAGNHMIDTDGNAILITDQTSTMIYERKS